MGWRVLTGEGWARELLAPLVAHPEHAGVFSDFDGTLAPIVADPAASRPLPGAVRALTDLAARVARLVVVSGRPASFLAHHLGGTGAELWGLYGLEHVVAGGRVVTHPDAASWREVVDEAAVRARRELPPTAGVEHKGLSITLHFRTDPHVEGAVRRWTKSVADATGLAMHAARMSWELRIPIERDKGTVVAELAGGLEAVCFLGDDRGDLSAFDVLDDLARRGAHCVRVGVQSDEAPAELLSRADVVVEGPDGVVGLLEAMRRSPS